MAMNKADRSLMEPGTDLLCPVCRTPLRRIGQRAVCRAGHSFDQARAGYIHLLPGGATGKFPGDSGPMLRARRRFLDRGYYDPLAAALNQQILAHLKQTGQVAGVIAEAGCGEGFYIGGVEQYLAQCAPPDCWRCWGFDLAKEAVGLAARRYANVGFFVADAHRPWLFADAALSVLLHVFAPRNPAQAARVVRPGGMVALVLPGNGHLQGLPPALRPVGIAPGKIAALVEQFGGMFTLTGKQRVDLPLALEGEALADLIQMTPNQRHLAPQTLVDLPGMELGAEFVMLLFRRR